MKFRKARNLSLVTNSLCYAGDLGERFLRGRPIFALAVVWITTAGHTMNFREMDAARGWVPAQGYGLHSALLFSIALGFMLARCLPEKISALQLTRIGLFALALGSFFNGCFMLAPYPILVAGRICAGLGSGFILQMAPSLLPANYSRISGLLGIFLPATAPGIVGGVTFLYGWSNWEGGFLFEGCLTILAFILFIPTLEGEFFQKTNTFNKRKTLAVLAMAVALGFLWHVLHRGQLDGWWESTSILRSATISLFMFAMAFLLYGIGEVNELACNLFPRLLLIFYAGFVQYFNVSDMGVYGGLLINFSSWERAWLVWSLSFGAATALFTAQFLHRIRGLHIAGLFTIALGMLLAHERTLGWNFWNPLNQIEFNWFAAPQHWELALARFCMGLGVGWVLYSMQQVHDVPVEKERAIRAEITVFQFLGGALSIGFLVNYLLVGHQAQYSYTSERGSIQQANVDDYREILKNELSKTGFSSPSHGSSSLMFKAMNYEADNLVFAHIYGTFFWSAILLAFICIAFQMLSFGKHLNPGKPAQDCNR
ncbi:MAG: hypothetical protein ACK5E4_06555 [Planctomycetia bacterium]